MADFINTIDALGDNAVIDSIIDGSITEFKDDKVTTVGSYAFNSCNALTTVDLPNVKTIAAGAFGTCKALIALILRNDAVVTLANSSALSGSAIANGTGYIYVPRARLAEYQAATNWSTYSAQFRALEDYTADGTVTGELDETKI